MNGKHFDSFEDMDEWTLKMRLMKTQIKVLKEQEELSRKQTLFNKILAFATIILAFTTLLSFINDGLTKLLFVGERFSWIGLIVALFFSVLFIWLLAEIINDVVNVKKEEKKPDNP